jgi:isoamylase
MDWTSFGPYVTRPCGPLPQGATVVPGGVRFAVFSRHATRLWLELFDEPTSTGPMARIALDRQEHRTGDIWSVLVQGVGAGLLYAYRAEGPWEPTEGHRFNPYKLLLDPYARAVTGTFDWDLGDARGFDPGPVSGSGNRDLAMSIVDSAGGCPKCIVMQDDFDWQGDRPPRIPMHDTVIYELHVRGFTVHPSSGVEHPGTFRGLMEKIPYLAELGVTAVELLPVQEFDERENPRTSPVTGEVLGNYWGYSTVSFFAPESRYSSAGQLGQQVTEFKELVRALHWAGIEVILDVVFNHTSEGDETGPTLCFRGLDNRIYYMLDPGESRHYLNLTGCGNTLNCNHPLVRDFILDCLRYWVVEMHVDGFRFDLASVLGRDQMGQLLSNPPLVERIAEDPVLRDCKIIAEAWDAAGAYQVGSFPGERWAEWNGQYRDDIRRFWRGDPGLVGGLATRLSGSADLYQGSGRTPLHSINFVTCHDGFTLADLVTYERKRNGSNGESNRDGTDDNHAWSCGVEGPTEDSTVLGLRDRQLRNFLATLLLSQGVPMLMAGDELRRTQQGNNNAYCQDNEVSWLDWTLLEEHGWLHDYVTALIGLRRRFPELRRSVFFTGAQGDGGRPDISWHSTRLGGADWSPGCRSLACWLNADPDLYLIFNASPEPLDFELPTLPAGRWRRVLDTADEEGRYLLALDQAQSLDEPTLYPAQAHSMVVLCCL